MNRCRIVLAVALLTAGTLAAPSRAAGREAPPHRIGVLVDLLGSLDYRQREQAHRDLAAIGPPAASHLTTAAQHPDLEVSLRARRLLHELQQHEAWSGSSVKLPPGRLRASDLVAEMERQTAVPLSLDEFVMAAGDPEIVACTREMKFWPAVDLLCSQLGGSIGWRFNTCGESILVGRPGCQPVAAASNGPLRCEIVSLQPAAATSDQCLTSSSMDLTLRLMWEPKLNVASVHSQPRIRLAPGCGRGTLAAPHRAAKTWQRVTPQLPFCTVTVPVAVENLARGSIQPQSIEWAIVAVGPDGTDDRRTARFNFAGVAIPVPVGATAAR